MTNLAPIALFAFKRPAHTRRLLESLVANPEAARSQVYVFCDGPRPDRPEELDLVNQVRALLREQWGCAKIEIVEQARNQGLARSVIQGVTQVLERHSNVIVLEDDLFVAPDFLRFMNDALEYFVADPRVFSITGFHYPFGVPSDYPWKAYFSHRFHSWGWATWRDRWKKVDWDARDGSMLSRFDRGGEDLREMLKEWREGIVDSWAVRFAYAHAQADAFCVAPTRSRVLNLGFDAAGTHTTAPDSRMAVRFAEPAQATQGYPPLVQTDPRIDEQIRRFHAFTWKYRLKRFLGFDPKKKLWDQRRR